MVGDYMSIPTLLDTKALKETLKMKLEASAAAIHPHFLSLSFWSPAFGLVIPFSDHSIA